MLLTTLLACAPHVSGVVAEADERLPNVVHLSWDLFSTPGDHWVEYGLDGTFDQASAREPTGTSTTIMGLKSGRTYSYRVVVETSDGERVESEVGEIDIEGASPELPSFTAETALPGEIEPGGLVLTSLIQEEASWIVVLDRDGDYVWYVDSDAGISVPGVRLDRDGKGVIYTQNAHVDGREYSGIVHQPFDGSERTLTATEDAHHDALQLADGRIAFLREYAVRDVEIEGGEVVSLANNEIAVMDEGDDDPENFSTLFNFKDDYGQTPWQTCGHFDDASMGGGKDWVHSNSLMLDDEGDLLVMSRNFDALISVPAGGGAPRWQLGGRFGDFDDVDGDVPDADDPALVDGPNHTWWSHGHMSHAWDGGFLVFDNGYHHEPQVSRVVEYALDVDDRTIEKVWEFASETDQFLPLLGDARRLPGGNTLVSWTLQGMLTEVTPGGEVAWRASVDLGAGTTRVRWVPDLYDPF